MKTKKSITNFFTSMICNLIVIIMGLVAQRIFIRILGAEYLGINGLFSNIISMLGIVELGIGNAIIYNLYKPLVEKDNKTINSLMKFYKNAYHVIAIIVFILGMSVIPFLSYFVGNNTLDINIKLVYIMFIIDITCSYLLSYKRSILYADQKNYIVNIIHMIYYVLLNALQLLVLYITKNYYLYLVIKIIMRLLENLIITLYVNKKYCYLDSKNASKLDKDIISDIIKKVKALFFHKIGTFLVLGSDNLIISRFLGLVTVGLYSNYNLIIEAVTSLFGQAINAVVPSVGHMLVEESKEKFFNVFKKIRFVNFWITNFASISILVVIQPFIIIWIGSDYLLSIFVLIILVFNFYQRLMRYSYSIFKDAAGIYYEDRFVPLVESILNIIVSILLVRIIGLPGVFIGTIVSGLALWCYSYPRFVYKKLFDRSYVNYFKETIGYIILFIINAVITYCVSLLFVVNNNILQLLVNALICLIIPNLLIVLVFRKTDNFKYFVSLINKILKKKKVNNVNNDIDMEIPVLDKDMIVQEFSNNELLSSYNDNVDNDMDKEVLSNREQISKLIREDNSVIKDIDFNLVDDDMLDIILDETKIYNFRFNNNYFLRGNKYPKILSNSYKFMRYVIDMDINNIAYIDIYNVDSYNLKKIIDYTFRKIYFLQREGNDITLDINGIFRNSDIINNDYFKECLRYVR